MLDSGCCCEMEHKMEHKMEAKMEDSPWLTLSAQVSSVLQGKGKPKGKPKENNEVNSIENEVENSDEPAFELEVLRVEQDDGLLCLRNDFASLLNPSSSSSTSSSSESPHANSALHRHVMRMARLRGYHLYFSDSETTDHPSVSRELSGPEFDSLCRSVGKCAENIHRSFLSWYLNDDSSHQQKRDAHARLMSPTVLPCSSLLRHALDLHLHGHSGLACAHMVAVLEQLLGAVYVAHRERDHHQHQHSVDSSDCTDKEAKVATANDDADEDDGKQTNRNSSRQARPNMVKELLTSSEVVQHVGNDLIVLMQVLVGPPTGFNLRNILWHGYVPLESFQNGLNHFTTLTFLTVLTLAERVQPLLSPFLAAMNNGESSVASFSEQSALLYRHADQHLCTHYRCPSCRISSSPSLAPSLAPSHLFPISASSASASTSVSKSDDKQQTLTQDQWDSEVLCDALIEIACSSRFIVPGRKKDVALALRMWLSMHDHHHQQIEQQQHTISVSVSQIGLSVLSCLLPVLEYCLRRLYVCANELPLAMLTAERDVFYTTLASILPQRLPNEEPIPLHRRGQLNALWDGVISIHLMHALSDLLLSQDGPRLRERVAHGEADGSEVALPSLYVDYLVGLFLALCIDVDHRAAAFGEFKCDSTMMMKARSNEHEDSQMLSSSSPVSTRNLQPHTIDPGAAAAAAKMVVCAWQEYFSRYHPCFGAQPHALRCLAKCFVRFESFDRWSRCVIVVNGEDEHSDSASTAPTTASTFKAATYSVPAIVGKGMVDISPCLLAQQAWGVVRSLMKLFPKSMVFTSRFGELWSETPDLVVSQYECHCAWQWCGIVSLTHAHLRWWNGFRSSTILSSFRSLATNHSSSLSLVMQSHSELTSLVASRSASSRKREALEELKECLPLWRASAVVVLAILETMLAVSFHAQSSRGVEIGVNVNSDVNIDWRAVFSRSERFAKAVAASVERCEGLVRRGALLFALAHIRDLMLRFEVWVAELQKQLIGWVERIDL